MSKLDLNRADEFQAYKYAMSKIFTTDKSICELLNDWINNNTSYRSDSLTFLVEENFPELYKVKPDQCHGYYWFHPKDRKTRFDLLKKIILKNSIPPGTPNHTPI